MRRDHLLGLRPAVDRGPGVDPLGARIAAPVPALELARRGEDRARALRRTPAVRHGLLVRHRQDVKARRLRRDIVHLGAEKAQPGRPSSGAPALHDSRPLKSSYPNSRTIWSASVSEFHSAMLGQANAVEGRGLDHRVDRHVLEHQAPSHLQRLRERVVADHVPGETGLAAETVGVGERAGLARVDDPRPVRRLDHVGHVAGGGGVEDGERHRRSRAGPAPRRRARRRRGRSPRPARGRARRRAARGSRAAAATRSSTW